MHCWYRILGRGGLSKFHLVGRVNWTNGLSCQRGLDRLRSLLDSRLEVIMTLKLLEIVTERFHIEMEQRLEILMSALLRRLEVPIPFQQDFTSMFLLCARSCRRVLP